MCGRPSRQPRKHTNRTTTGERGKFVSKQGEFGGSSHNSLFSSRRFTFKDAKRNVRPRSDEPPSGADGESANKPPSSTLLLFFIFMKASRGNSNYARRILPVYRYYSGIGGRTAGGRSDR